MEGLGLGGRARLLRGPVSPCGCGSGSGSELSALGLGASSAPAQQRAGLGGWRPPAHPHAFLGGESREVSLRGCGKEGPGEHLGSWGGGRRLGPGRGGAGVGAANWEGWGWEPGWSWDPGHRPLLDSPARESPEQGVLSGSGAAARIWEVETVGARRGLEVG